MKKAVQVMLDEAVIVELDADPDVKQLGRSELVRRAIDEYLRRRRRSRIRAGYRSAYGKSGGLGPELEGWSEEGEWPDD